MVYAKIVRLSDAIELISNNTDTFVDDIINTLTGLCFNEEEAKELLFFAKTIEEEE